MRPARVILNAKSPLINTPAWVALLEHFERVEKVHMVELFDQDPERFKKYSIQFNDMLLDYSKNRVTDVTMKLLFSLAEQAGVEKWRDKMFSGEKINNTEGRAVLHTALRNRSGKPVFVDDENVMPLVDAELEKMRDFSDKVRNGQWIGYAGLPITNVVNIGIGGSDLGPNMVCRALEPYSHKSLRVHFVSNVDGSHIGQMLSYLRPETTLFIVASKTFTTQETLTNANTAKKWFLEGAGRVTEGDISKHFVAVSTNEKEVEKFGIDPVNMFRFWDWVGGRYSLWSAVGLASAIYVGMDNFIEMLEGAHEMDNHFQEQPLDQNIPVILAMLGIWYGNFFHAESSAVLPYDHNLRMLPAYLEQADMESNGKSVDREGRQATYSTGKIIWGAEGINGQHAFYQLLHQGTRLIPTDFIASIQSHGNHKEHCDILASNFLAQTEALMKGRTMEKTREQLKEADIELHKAEKRLPHMIFSGNQPSNSIVIKKLTPKALGSLLAMYEHKIFVQGIVWNLNSYDQWGVELGKKLAKNILEELEDGENLYEHDSSTLGLLDWFRKNSAK
ncbi:glucose-6-phosphate isomerase [Cocleimonas sp. KMM 6892]|uniref:glucose-6-phosphate isomerase n=1 Tax=unclassified Cocleimonas TaxID=2639732 RepID=UPI002DBB8204|nr:MULTISPECIES: glucose-6-phosphate isomerase [unclassified Cocleimonas]MEB8433460.1 glucose-6-phosphate isomerase [Cocleimonas sp. KMM 6892]MEC4716271.1 glucose-6-phosphate isomerase [Cocleimonas sp. KMM 6895]MEC4745836.1 glucose-6-phosphate isomerase [Cocleimonas sp. KMM 6896]